MQETEKRVLIGPDRSSRKQEHRIRRNRKSLKCLVDPDVN